jgi:endonuclease/exonuclease/phosphatase (EEP) superfamily protein YafD
MPARQAPAPIAWIVALLLIAATLIPIVASDQWWIRIFVLPQAQFTILLLLLALAIPFLLDLSRTAPNLLMAAVAACLVYQLHYLLRYTPIWPVEARTARACAAQDRLRVLVLNLREGNERAGPVLALVRATNPDLFLALETDRYWVRALQPLKAEMPKVVSAPRNDAWG